MATQAAGAEKPHVVFFPFPTQGHITPALQLAKLLHRCKGFDVTFVLTEYNSRRLLRSRGPDALAGIPGFRFATIRDSLPPSDEYATHNYLVAILLSEETIMAPQFKKLISELPPVTCVISDVEHILRTSKAIGLPCVTFWTMSASSFLVFQQSQQLVDKGIVPLKDGEQLANGYLHNTVVHWVPGMPKQMRLKDFPSFIRTTDPDDAIFRKLLSLMESHRTCPSAVIFHTFDELERDAVTSMSNILPVPPIYYTVGPLPLLLKQVAGSPVDALGSNLLKENDTCLDWLRGKRPNSVVYASFGSLVTPTNEQLVEFAWGLANSSYEFLWVMKNDQAKGAAPTLVLPPEFLEKTKDRGYVTSWCPQEAVLRHEAIGAFLTHCGWNSMFESLCAGVPMLCWPTAADQQPNSMYACTEWHIGMGIDENVGREEVERAVREVMGGEKGKDMRSVAMEWKEKIDVATLPGGSSWANLERVVDEVIAPLMQKH